jgi:phosphoribosylamine--glycine ligase
MKVEDEPFVIEYNCRMGDPETEVVIPRLKNDLVALLVAAAKGELHTVTIEQDQRVATTIMAVSGGYPNDHKKGLPISELKEFEQGEDILVFHAGTKEKDGAIVTNGGRVFCVTALADTIEDAIGNAKLIMDTIDFEDKYYRKDIGYEFVNGE